MLSGFFQSKTTKPPTRLENCQELKQIIPLLQKLKNKEAELKADASLNGSGSVGYRKYLVVTALMKQINALVDSFNKMPTPSSVDKNLEECIEFVRCLGETIRAVGLKYGRTLNEQRNKNKELASSSIRLGAFSATVATSFVMPVTIVGRLITFFYIAPKVSNKLEEAMGASDGTTATILLLKDFVETLHAVFNNLNFAKHTGFAAIADQDEEAEQNVHNITSGLIIEEYIEPAQTSSVGR